MTTATDLITDPLVVTETGFAADAEEVWTEVTTPAGVNRELAPLLRMTVPKGWKAASIADVESGTHIGRSWLLLGGVLPIEFDDLTIAELGPGRRFLEHSTVAMCTTWVHERTVDERPDGCSVVDGVGFVHRRPIRWLPGAAALQRTVLGAIFRHRHRRLAKAFDVSEPTRQRLERGLSP